MKNFFRSVYLSYHVHHIIIKPSLRFLVYSSPNFDRKTELAKIFRSFRKKKKEVAVMITYIS